MSDRVEIISDGDGIAVLGSQSEVDDFLASLALSARPLPLDQVKERATRDSRGSGNAPEILGRVGVWLKSSDETLRTLGELGLVPSGVDGVLRTALERVGSAKNWTDVSELGASILGNPAVMSGVAGVMAQTVLQASLEEITDYLKRIDKKLDDVIRSQTNSALARVDGVRFAINEATAIKEATGKVSDVTWSKIQASSTTLFETEAYALRQIQDETIRIKTDVGMSDMFSAIKTVESNIPMWLTILTNCSALYDMIAILELDRVMDASPADLDNHRIGLKAAREKRVRTIAVALEGMLGRLGESVERANSKVLFNPIQTPKTIDSCRTIAVSIIEVSAIFGFTTPEQKAEAKRWVDAASERIDATRQATAGTAEAVQHVGKEAAATAKALKSKMTEKLTERQRRKDES